LSLLRSGARPAFTAAELPLAEEVARRAALAIENARLFQRAQKANQAKTEFLANVSHEIRTPLGAILGFTEILQTDDVNDEERGRYLSIIRRNGQQLSELIGDLLDLSKIESGKLDLDVSRFSLKQVISDLMSTFSFKAREKGVAIETSFDPDLPDMIATDQLRLKQIIINIIGNAVKFSSRGKISIHVRSNPRHGQNLIAIDVRDEGIGIAPEAREKLFHAFTQADSTMSRRFGGTGLGLLLARRLAHALEGNVELVWSEVGKGSTFEITFKPDLFNDQVPLAVSTQPTAVAAPTPTPTPVAAPAPVPVPVPIPAPPKETSAPAYAGRVLVVEDSPDNQVLVGRMLKKKGVTVEFADNGAEGVHKGSSQLFDLILMDIQMPVLDGYSAISQLREKGIQTPIVALTAHAMHEDRQHCMSVGCNDYVTKPIDAHRLTEIVARYLRQPGRPGATGGES
jgi:CheY-like chemotaxis protein/nitrogen-specific signal transduction histidine kinase